MMVASYVIVTRLRQNGYNGSSAAPHFHNFSERLDWHREDIADATLSPDHSRHTWINLQLASQPQDLNVDALIEDILVNTVACNRCSRERAR